MLYLYLVALLSSIGVLALQTVLGDRGDGHASGDHGASGHDPGQLGQATQDPSEPGGEGHELSAGGFVLSTLLSVRFWLFAALAFGMSGTLLSLLQAASTVLTAVLASTLGLGSGVFATVAYRMVRASSSTTIVAASDATGEIGRVLVSFGRGARGQIRVTLKGQSVDLVASTDEEVLSRGTAVLVEDVREGVAHVSRSPEELS